MLPSTPKDEIYNIVTYFVCVCGVCVCLLTSEHRSYLSENQKCKNQMFVDFDICHQMASLRKFYSVTLTYFLKVKYSNRDLLNVANAHSRVTNASTAVLRAAPCPDTSLPTAANAHSSVTSTASSVMKAIFATKQIAS